LANALKFTDKGNINFGYELKGDFIEFYTSDTGIGIPKEMFEDIFKRFHQVENSLSRLYGGTGLGLAISKAYVELLGGKIWLSSELNKGSVFYFTVPYKKVTIDKNLTKKSVQEKTLEFLNKRTVLIAEDEEFNFRFLEEILAGFNLEIIHAWNGLEAVEICRSNKKVELVIMDLKMPVMDGYEAVMKIREFSPALPIIAQTAYSSEAEKEKAIICGCNDYLTKPFSKKLLYSIIKEYFSND
jgi:CheY-like chemotaxis protein